LTNSSKYDSIDSVEEKSEFLKLKIAREDFMDAVEVWRLRRLDKK
jgi:hypothetical protein